MAENIYDFLCLYGLTKVGMISIVEERTMPQTMNDASVHHVQEVINVIESQLKTRLTYIHQISTTQGRYSEGQEYHEAE